MPTFDHLRFQGSGVPVADGAAPKGAALQPVFIGYCDRVRIISLSLNPTTVEGTQDVEMVNGRPQPATGATWVELGGLDGEGYLELGRVRYPFIRSDGEFIAHITHGDYDPDPLDVFKEAAGRSDEPDDQPDDVDIVIGGDPCDDRPTMDNLKAEIVDWLDGVGVAVDHPAWASLTKAELLDWVDDVCNEVIPVAPQP